MAVQTPAQQANLDGRLRIGTHVLASRLIVGTGKYASYELMSESLALSGADCITVAVRRERLIDSRGKNILDFIDTGRYTLLPNTAGCFRPRTQSASPVSAAKSCWDSKTLAPIGSSSKCWATPRRCCRTRSPRSRPPRPWWPKVFRFCAIRPTTRSSRGG